MTRGHCTTPQSLREMPKWIKAYDAGLDPHDYEEATNTSVALVKMLVAKIREDILAGDFAIDSKDALAVIRMNYEYEQTSGIKTDYGANEIYIAVSVFMAHVQAVLARFCPMDQQDALDYFHRLLDADPIIKALIEQSREYDGKIDYDEFDVEDDGEEIFDAEVVKNPTQVVDEPPAIGYTQPGNEEDFVDPTLEWEPLEP